MTFFRCLCERIAWFDEYLPGVVDDTLRAETGRSFEGAQVEQKAVALVEAYGLRGAASFLAVDLQKECGCEQPDQLND